MLIEEFIHNPLVGMYHMACDVDHEKREVTFLYKLRHGVCPRSYGMNVANMAGIPRSIVDRAEAVADTFEKLTLERSTSKQQKMTTSTNGLKQQHFPTSKLADFIQVWRLSDTTSLNPSSASWPHFLRIWSSLQNLSQNKPKKTPLISSSISIRS
jgi:DNA mismatch repair ATPase MutS